MQYEKFEGKEPRLLYFDHQNDPSVMGAILLFCIQQCGFGNVEMLNIFYLSLAR
jgi:hypothetical protein